MSAKNQSAAISGHKIGTGGTEADVNPSSWKPGKIVGEKSVGTARAQRSVEKWIPGSGVVSDVPVGYDGP